jgi:hypothetical protein
MSFHVFILIYMKRNIFSNAFCLRGTNIQLNILAPKNLFYFLISRHYHLDLDLIFIFFSYKAKEKERENKTKRKGKFGNLHLVIFSYRLVII